MSHVRHVQTSHWSPCGYYPIPQYPFTIVAMDVVHLATCKVKKDYMVDACLVVVCRATGYIIVVPTTMQGLTKEKLAELFLDKCVFLTGLPSEILTDNAKYFNNKFVHMLR